MTEQNRIKSGSDIIFYDGICGLCNRFVQFVLAHEGSLKFLFCSLQSDIGAKLLSKYGEDSSDLKTIFVISDYGLPSNKLQKKSQAVLFIIQHCQLPWYVPEILFSFLHLWPASLLDIGYDVIAGVRYKIFGRYDSCSIPDKEVRDRFVDQ